MPDLPPELLKLQVIPGGVRPSTAHSATDLLLPPGRVADRLRHFPENVYDLSPESHLSRFMKVLLGDSGVGQLRKRLMLTRMQSTLQGSRFYDLDRFYGALFGLKRSVDETLAIDPYTSNATHDEWEQMLSQDASFRSRIEQFSRAIAYGATPTGMELVAEALLSVDCDVYESWIQADAGYQTYQELEDQYGPGTPGGTYNEMEGETYSTLEGYGLARLSGDERRIFYVRPKRNITLAEAYDLRRVLFRIKPADSRFVILTQGSPAYELLSIGGVASDSEHWEVVSKVSSNPSSDNPYQETGSLKEQPRPPFSGYQGEAWSYVGDVAGVVPSMKFVGGEHETMPTQRYTFHSGQYLDFSAEQAILPKRMVQAGRVASDAILISHPYSGVRNVSFSMDYAVLDSNPHKIANLFVDGVPMDALAVALRQRAELDPFQQNPLHRYWVSPERDMDDETEEGLEIRLTSHRMVNYINLEVSHFPHKMIVETYDTESAIWIEVFSKTLLDSYPRMISHGSQVSETEGHPLHSLPGHWMKLSQRISPTSTKRIRVRMVRADGVPPTMSTRRDGAVEPQAIPYSLGIRGLDVGYRVSSRDDFSYLDDPTFAGATDVLSNPVTFSVKEALASNALDGTFIPWRSEPQPVNYAVVNFYLDTRDEGDGTVIDRFYLDPTHAGPHMSIYYSMDPEETDGTDEFYAERTWTPIPRDYTLHKGYVHIPTTRARYWKFEFTNLAVEPYETFFTFHRRVRLFPQNLVEAIEQGYSRSEPSMPKGMHAAIEASRVDHYRDAVQHLAKSSSIGPTETLYISDPNGQNRLNDKSWVWGFTPWHQRDKAPRFPRRGQHRYTEVDVRHNTKVGFFVGLREVRAYRSRFEANDDTMVYLDTFDDFRNLTAGFTWAFETGYLTAAGATLPVEAESRVFHSRNNVKAVQFATVQSPPVQLVPDHEFKSAKYLSYDWDDPDDFMRVGDAQLLYQSSDTTVLNIRYVVPPPKALTRTGDLVQPVVKPTFLDRDTEIADLDAAAATVGGLATPLLGLSPEGRCYAAVRFTMDTDQSSPLILQIVDYNDSDAILIEKEITAQKGETVEDYLAYDIPAADMAVRVRLVQEGKSNDAWRVDALSMFDESMVWEFSNNGGSNWYPAIQMKNNQHGILTFPEVGNHLRYRVRAFRNNIWVSAIKIRPQYVGVGNARMNGTHRGPNVSLFDQDVPIQDDPLFTSWTHPIPYRWFSASRRFPLLPVEGAPFVSEFSKFLGRPMSETLAEPEDVITGSKIFVRTMDESITGTDAVIEWPLPLGQVVNTLVHPVSGRS